MRAIIVSLMDGSKVQITEEEYTKLAGKTGLVFIPSIQETINMLSITRIYPLENQGDEKNHKVGMLLDGRTVVKRFGQWYLMRDDLVNADGEYDCQPDPTDCPEIRYDCVPSVGDYQRKYSKMSREEAIEVLCGNREARRIESTGLTPIKEIQHKF